MNIDTELLRRQRNELVELASGQRPVADTDLDGIINLCDALLDKLELEENNNE